MQGSGLACKFLFYMTFPVEKPYSTEQGCKGIKNQRIHGYLLRVQIKKPFYHKVKRAF